MVLKGAPIYFEINDRSIVIKSPGLPEPPVTLEQIKSFSAPSFSRNPVIMYVLDKLDYAEQRGLGFETVKDLPRKNIQSHSFQTGIWTNCLDLYPPKRNLDKYLDKMSR